MIFTGPNFRLSEKKDISLCITTKKNQKFFKMTLYFSRNQGYITGIRLNNLLQSGSRTVIAAQLPAFIAAWTHCVCFEDLQVAVSVRDGGSALYEFVNTCKPSSFVVTSEAEETNVKRQNRERTQKMSDLFTQVGTDNCQSETLQVLTKSEVMGRQFQIYGTVENPLFRAKDVAEWLEIQNVSQLVKDVDESEKGIFSIYTPGGVQNVNMLTEDGLYEVLMLSRKPIAKQFKKRVKEILHEVRTKGGYIAAKPEETPEIIMARALKVADATLKRQEEQLAQARATIAQQGEKLELAAPKVAFVQTFATSTTGNILVRDFAGMLQRGLGMKGFGQNALFDWLKKNGYMNLNRYPSQRSTDLKLMKSTEGFHVHKDGTTGTHHCTRITPKGQTYFFEKIKAQYESAGRWW